MKLLLSLLFLLLISSSVLAAPLPDMFPALPAPAPPHLFPHQPGDLARDRLGKMAPMLLLANTVSVPTPQQYRPTLPPDQAKAALVILSKLILNDQLYVRDAPPREGNTKNCLTMVVGDSGKEVIVSVWRDKPLMTIRSYAPEWSLDVNYLPVLPEVAALFQAVDPGDPGPNSVLVKVPPPLPSTEAIPFSVLARIATLKPGMTRADVLRLFTTEGGLSTPYWNHYVYRYASVDMATDAKAPNASPVVLDELIKANIDFAPPDADIVWLGGRGFWLGQAQYQASLNRISQYENPNDIVLKVSAPYLQYSIID